MLVMKCLIIAVLACCLLFARGQNTTQPPELGQSWTILNDVDLLTHYAGSQELKIMEFFRSQDMNPTFFTHMLEGTPGVHRCIEVCELHPNCIGVTVDLKVSNHYCKYFQALGGAFTASNKTTSTRHSSAIRASATSGPPTIWLSKAFADGMVLQRDTNYSIWGYSTKLPEGTPLTLTMLSNDSTTVISRATGTISDKDGLWKIGGHGVSAGGPYSVKITVENTTLHLLQAVLFGDVFLCSGASNMGFGVADSWQFNNVNCQHGIKEYLNPLIRLFQSTQDNPFPIQYPKKEVTRTDPYAWAPADSVDTVCGKCLEHPEELKTFKSCLRYEDHFFSAECFWFGVEVAKARNNTVPIGLVQVSKSGLGVQPWNPPGSIEAACGSLFTESDAKYSSQVMRGSNATSQLWSSRMAQITSMGLAGFLFTIGESNVRQPISLHCMFPAFLDAVRSNFLLADNDSTPIVFLELGTSPNQDLKTEPPQLLLFGQQTIFARISMEDATLLPSVALAQTLDLGTPYTEYNQGEAHWRNKRIAMSRAAQRFLALNGEIPSTTVLEGPVPSKIAVLMEDNETASDNVCSTPLTFFSCCCLSVDGGSI
ncbi:hypothetical protein CYMTET_46462 [Cymbomonas tetramitiformis]|uniref:Uncharacterized protein n=1 Tax=Cymbomonas tetramitiformis TaxID=36881 RepID=A0AAE0BW57_9CHLO|nr:hypothetical protein CYMTET_46462 [Cymbomonas tetramitiformis]